MDDRSSKTQRDTYSLLEFAGDVGGAYEFLYLTFYVITKYFLEYNFLALAALRMYTDKGKTLEVPRYFAAKMCVSHFGCQKWKAYQKKLRTVEQDIKGSLDISMFLRRLKLHGFALDYLLDKRVLKGLSVMCDQKPIQYVG